MSEEVDAGIGAAKIEHGEAQCPDISDGADDISTPREGTNVSVNTIKKEETGASIAKVSDRPTPNQCVVAFKKNEESFIQSKVDLKSNHFSDTQEEVDSAADRKARKKDNVNEKDGIDGSSSSPCLSANEKMKRRLSSSVEQVDLEFSLGSLESPPPSKRQCVGINQNDPMSSGSTGSKKKILPPGPPMMSAAAALKPKFWKDAAAVSYSNVAASSFSVAEEEGGSSPLAQGWELANEPQMRLSADEHRSIADAEEVMRVATLAAQTMSDGNSTPATPPNANEGQCQYGEGLSGKKEILEGKGIDNESKKNKGWDDFDNQAGMADTDDEDGVDSNISSASSLAESFVGEGESRPVPPAPPSTPATSRDIFQPLPYHPDSTGGELAYGVDLKWEGQAKDDGNAIVPAYLAASRSSLPLPPFCGDDTMTPLPDRKVTADSSDMPSQKSTPTPSQEAEPSADISGADTEPTRGGVKPDDHNEQKDRQNSQQVRLTRKLEFDHWDVGDRYQLKRMLGRGSYGEVAQAIDLHSADLQQESEEASQQPQAQNSAPQHRNSSFVAVKKISKAFDQEVDATRLFREMHILRRLRGHECIIQLVDVVQPRSADLKLFNDLYLVFEFVDTDLYKLIMSPQYLTTEHIQTFLYQMLVGLKFIHSSSVIHRDLKPANILLNEDCTLKICDFGLARIVHNEKIPQTTITPVRNGNMGMATLDTHVTLPAPVVDGDSQLREPQRPNLSRQLTKHVVTRWYRAPELILIQPYASAVDIWSMGCIFAELLSMQEGSVPSYQDRAPLFPGGSCYPLSGDTGSSGSDERLDQLSVIFSVIGMPSEEDLKSVGKVRNDIQQYWFYICTLVLPKLLRLISLIAGK